MPINRNYKVIRGHDGRFAVTNSPKPDRTVYFESAWRAEAIKFAMRMDEQRDDAKKLAGCILYGAGVAAMIWLILWASTGYAAELELRWQAPTENVDGSPLTDLSGYRVYVGPTSRNYTSSATLSDPNATEATVSVPIDWLAEGDNAVFVAMTAIDEDGNESGYSNEITKTVAVAPTIPGEPTVITVTITITATECPAGQTCSIDVEVTQ